MRGDPVGPIVIRSNEPRFDITRQRLLNSHPQGRPAKAFSPRTASSPSPGIRQTAIRSGIRFERNAAVFISTNRENRCGSSTAAPMPMQPPQSCPTSVMSRRSRVSINRHRFETCESIV